MCLPVARVTAAEAVAGQSYYTTVAGQSYAGQATAPGQATVTLHYYCHKGITAHLTAKDDSSTTILLLSPLLKIVGNPFSSMHR